MLSAIRKRDPRFTPAKLFFLAFAGALVIGGVTGFFPGSSTLDIHLHDTFYVVESSHVVMAVAGFLGIFAGIYHWFPRLFGRFMNKTTGYIHFWVTVVGIFLIFWRLHYEGLAGMPRRYIDYQNRPIFNQFGDLNIYVSATAIVVFAAQLLIISNFFHSLVRGRKVKADDISQRQVL